MTSSTLSRRRLLRAGTYALTLPALESLAPRGARAASKPPVRLVFYFQPDGTMEGPERFGDTRQYKPTRELWFPEGEGANFTLRELNAPLEPLKQDLIFFRGVNLSLPGTYTHNAGMRHAMTCGTPNSIDQVVGEQVGRTTRFKTLEIGVGTQYRGELPARLHYKDGASIPAEANPNVVFQKLFGSNPGGSVSAAEMEALVRLQGRRKSVLDGVVEELKALETRAGKDDREKLEAHVGSVRDLEKALVGLNGAMAESTAAACGKPQVDFSLIKDQKVWGVTYGSTVPNLDKIAQVQQELAVLALRCDLTRVATVFYQRSTSTQTFPFLPIKNKNAQQHVTAHHCWRSAELVEDYKTIKKWQTQMYRELLEKMKGVREADGSTLLDNALVLWLSEMNVGNHGQPNMPYVMAGRGGGAVKPGRYLVYNGVKQSRLFLSMAHAAGARLEKFGPDSEPLTGLGG